MRLRLDPHIILLLAFSIFALAPLTAPGYFIYAHDARHSVYFLQMFDLSFRDGAWYPRWATDMVFGYGYPLWVLLPPIPFFAGEVFHLVGFDFVTAVKLVDGFALFLSGLTMYLFASRVLGRTPGLVAAVAYLYIPYHLVDLYVRAAQAELVSFIFPPLIFWALYQMAATLKTRYVPLLALSFAGLVLTHVSIAAIFAPLVALYGLYLIVLQCRENGALRVTRQAVRFAALAVFSALLAAALAAAFLVPVLFEQPLLTSDPLIGGFFNYRKHFVSASQLLSPFWGFGYAGENGADQFSLQLGLLPVLLSFTAIWGLGALRSEARRQTLFFSVLSVGVVIAMLPVSAPLWELLAGAVAYLQFPWRLLEMAALALAFLSGAAICPLSSREQNSGNELVAALAVILALVVISHPYTEPQHTEAVFNYRTQMEFEVKDRELLGDTIWMEAGKRPQDSPLVEQYLRGEPLTKAVSLDEGALVETLDHRGQSDKVRVVSANSTRIMFYTRYFPGWTASLDGQPIGLRPYGEQGLILVEVPAGEHTVEIRFGDTPPRQIGQAVSGAALVLACWWLWHSIKGERRSSG